jgi:hypothetical protein
MIVCTTQPLYRYSGLSTDIKPTKDIKDASTFWETDTGDEFEWRGVLQWIKLPHTTVAVETPINSEIENASDVVTTVDLSNPALLSIASVSASVGKTATTTVAISSSALVITRSIA